MREILFRGQAFGSREWVCGHYRNGRKIHIIYHDENSDNCYAVRPETIGQFTGLTDKNGNKIFEGDILDCKSGLYERCEVIFNEFCSAFQLMCADGFSDFFLCSINHKEMEIIGNIHDNPELLEKP